MADDRGEWYSGWSRHGAACQRRILAGVFRLLLVQALSFSWLHDANAVSAAVSDFRLVEDTARHTNVSEKGQPLLQKSGVASPGTSMDHCSLVLRV
jgi:hypothetical protein